MRTALTLAALLISTSALAQTVAPADPISSNPIPFNTQRATGDGVPIAQPAPAPAPMQATPPAPASGGGMGLGKIFDEADTNRDNVVTREEFIAKANQHFGMADKNKDNKITREEMNAQQGAFMQQMQRNLLGGGTLQNKIDQFMGTGSAVPTNLAPTAPTVTPPTPPTPPRTY